MKDKPNDWMIEEEYQISNHIKMVLINKKTEIHIDNQRFATCLRLIFNLMPPDIKATQELTSIDAIKDFYEKNKNKNSYLPLDYMEEFRGHCSNIQVWVENDYNTEILEKKLAFPILERLATIGDNKAKAVLREEIIRRMGLNYLPVQIYLIQRYSMEIFTLEELISLSEDIDFSKFCEDDISKFNSLLFRKAFNKKDFSIKSYKGFLRRLVDIRTIKKTFSIDRYINSLFNSLALYHKSFFDERGYKRIKLSEFVTIMKMGNIKLNKLNLNDNTLRSFLFDNCKEIFYDLSGEFPIFYKIFRRLIDQGNLNNRNNWTNALNRNALINFKDILKNIDIEQCKRIAIQIEKIERDEELKIFILKHLMYRILSAEDSLSHLFINNRILRLSKRRFKQYPLYLRKTLIYHQFIYFSYREIKKIRPFLNIHKYNKIYQIKFYEIWVEKLFYIYVNRRNIPLKDLLEDLKIIFKFFASHPDKKVGNRIYGLETLTYDEIKQIRNVPKYSYVEKGFRLKLEKEFKKKYNILQDRIMIQKSIWDFKDD